MFAPIRYNFSKTIKYSNSDEEMGVDSFSFLKTILKVLLNAEQEIELTRKALNSKYSFSSYECFEMIKPKKSSFFNKDDVNFSNFSLECL